MEEKVKEEVEVKSKSTTTGTIILLVVALVIGLFMIRSCVRSMGTAALDSSAATDVVFTEKHGEKLSSIGSLLITGEVKNNSETQTYSYLKIYGYAFDKDGNQIGMDFSYLDSTTLPPGASSTFSVYVDCNVSKADTYKVKVVDD